MVTILTMLSTRISSSSQATLSTQACLMPPSACLRPASRFRHRSRLCQQSRAFRFGPWSSYLDPTFQKELRHRHRVAKHKYMEAVNRRLSWDRQQLPNYANHVGLKGFMCSAWHRREPMVAGRWANLSGSYENNGEPREFEREVDERQKKLDQRLRNLHSSLEDRLSSTWRIVDASLQRAGFDNLYATDGQTGPKTQRPSPSETSNGKEGPEYQAPPSSQEYEIDPITNRKVFKNPTAKKDNSSRQSIPVPVKTFKGYRSQFHVFEPPTSDAATRGSKRETGTNQESVDRRMSTQNPGTKPVESAQSHTPTPNQANESASSASPKSSHQSTVKAEMLDDGYARYDAKYFYAKPFMAYEPDGKAPTLEEEIPDPVEEGYKAYDQKIAQEKQNSTSAPKSSIGAKAAHLRSIWKGDDFFSRENGDKYFTRMTERMTKKFEDMMEQERIQVVKSTPQPKSTEECLKAYDSKVCYSKPFMAYEANDGKAPTLEKEAPDPVEQGYNAFDSKMSYEKPFLAYEANDGKAPTLEKDAPDPAEQGYKAFDSKMSYEKPFLAYEANDGKAPTLEKETPDPVEEGYKAYDHKHPYGPVSHNESHGQREARDPVQDGLREYDSRISYSPKPVSGQQSKYQKLFSSISEEESIPSKNESKAEIKPNELRNAYNNGIEGKREGRSKRENLEQQFSAIQSPHSRAWETLWFEGVKNPRSPLDKTSTESGIFDKTRDEATRNGKSSVSSVVAALDLEEKAKHTVTTGSLAGSKNTSSLSTSGKAKEIIKNLAEQKRVGPRTKITGNFIRDFPEETNVKWTTDGSKPLLPNKSSSAEVESKVQNAEKEYIDGLAPRLNFSRKPHTPRLQSALDRTTSASMGPLKQSSATPQPIIPGEGDLSASIAAYNSPTGSPFTINKTPSLAKSEPTLYKILAYDPTMQSISIAETTSVTPDTSSSCPLTPAEVLLRLSNPAKFFPHFAPLQEEGYEIASGSGDVLVFRKVRDGKIAMVGRRNPIDGMQSPPTGNFASPTGFVNYDSPIPEASSESTTLPQSSEEVGKERFKSGIDVRREEPVFSGQRRWEDEAEGKKERKQGRGKRLLIGAFWVGACSYAVGVVAEFFKTGGFEGAGIKGF